MTFQMLDAETRVLSKSALWSARLLAMVVLATMLPSVAVGEEKQSIGLVLQLGHQDQVKAVAFSPDGRTVLSSSEDGTHKLWDVASGRELHTFTGRRYSSSSAFSPDGRTVLGTALMELKLWDIASRRELRTFSHEGVVSVAFSPDGLTAVSGSQDGTIKLWDVASGRELRTFARHRDWVKSVGISPDGRTVLSGSSDKTVKLWDVTTGRLLRTFSGHGDQVNSVAFSPDGRNVLSGSGDNRLKLWETATGREVRTFKGHEGTATSVAFSPDGRTVLSGSYDWTLKLWDVASGRELRTFTGHKESVASVAFSRDGRTMLSSSDDGTIKLWDVVSGQELRTFTGSGLKVGSIAHSFDGRTVLAGTDAALALWDVASGRELRTFTGHAKRISSVAFSPDGRTVLSGSYDETLKLWDVTSGRELRTFTGHRNHVESVAFSPDGRMVLSGSNDETLKLWDVATGRELRTFKGHRHCVNSVVFSPDGRTVLSGSLDGTRKLWDVASGRELRTFTGFNYSSVNPVAFSPDGRTLLAGSTLYDVATGRELRTFTGASLVSSVAFSPDGRTALASSDNKTFKLWDLSNGRELRTFTGHSDLINSVTFSPDGHTVLSGSNDTTVRIWSIATGHELARRVSSKDGHWLIITPAGYFDRGGDSELPLHLVRDMEILSIDQAFEHLYRPDLIEAILKGDPEGKHKDAAHALNLADILASGPAPQIEHVADRDERAGDSVRLSVRLTGRGGGVGKHLVWRVNGVVQGNPTPTALALLDGPLASAVITESLRLGTSGTNLVEIVAYNRAGLVATPPLNITVDKLGSTTSERPRMFVLALGVNKYRMKEYQLSYAASDAKSFARAIGVVGSTLFGEVKATVLTDEQVSEAGIAAAMTSISREAKPDDVFVMLLGGHGKSIAGRYYYYPQTLEFGLGHTVETHGIGQDKWEAWLARITVQKSLLIIDTCEGDAFRGARGTDSVRQTAMAQLQHATGRNIIAASRDAAYEGYRGHGVLTYAILEALDKTTSVGGDDRVRVAALADYIGVRVPEISQKSFGIYQNPTRKLTGNDFPIGIRQEVLAASNTGPAIPSEPTHVLIRQELLREQPAADAPGGRTLPPGSQVRAVEFVGAWVIIARDGQKLGYVPTEALARIQ